MTPLLLANLAGNLFTFQFCALIDIARLQRCVFVGRRMFDVTVDADGAAVHDALDTRSRGRFDNFADGCGIYCAIARRRDAGLPINRRDVIDNVDAGQGEFDGTTIANVAGNELNPGRLEITRAVHIPNERANVMTVGHQTAGEVPAGKSGRTGYESAHRSARTVTGDANTRANPAPRSIFSDSSATRADPNSLYRLIGSTKCRSFERI